MPQPPLPMSEPNEERPAGRVPERSLAELSDRASTRKGKEALQALRDKYKQKEFNFNVAGVEYGECVTNVSNSTCSNCLEGQ